jgi:hypothetical protein
VLGIGLGAGEGVMRQCVLAAMDTYVLFVLATVVKYFGNEFDMAYHDAYDMPWSGSSENAKKQGKWIANCKIDPMKLSCEGKTYEFEEAWLEAAYEPYDFLIWFSGTKRADWNYFCLRPKTSLVQGGFHYEIKPEFPRDFNLSGVGSKGRGFTYWGVDGHDLCFQKVPTDLRSLKLSVSVDTYGKGKDTKLGTVQLTLDE